ncbi:acyl-CoA dehydrogenase family protein [Rummeliibacillus pycnus]
MLQMMKEFVDEEVAPRTVERVRTKQFPKRNFEHLGEMGIMELHFEETYSEAGVITISFAIITEELS